jgi:hypothetical protein
MKRFIAILRDSDGEEMKYRFLERDIEAARKRAMNLADEAKMQFVSVAEEPEEGGENDA